jgi:succinoglycan biosynthesis protein ExoA
VEDVAVSVLVPVLNEEEHIEATVERLRAQRFDGGELEFLLIDGGSTDATRPLIERMMGSDPRVRVLDNPQGAISPALNIGLRAARGRYVARMDAHTLCEPDYLARGVERLSRGDVIWASGPQLAEGNDTWSRRVALALHTRLGIGGASFRVADREIEVDAGFLGVWHRETLLEQGGWDESWPINEDGELAARITAAHGRIVCVPEMAVRYIPRNGLRALTVQYWRYGQYRAKTCRAHPQSMRRSHILAPGLALTTLAAALPLRLVARPARAGLALYAVAVATTAGSRVRSAGPRDAASQLAILPTMHLSWGFGFLLGAVRFGPPFAAFARLLRGLLPG